MPLTLALGAALSFAVLAWLRREWRGRLLQLALVLGALAWVALDLRGLDDLWAKHALTSSIYSGKSWQDRARLQPDEDVAGFAQLTRQQASSPGAGQRVLVASDSVYKMLRLIYFLLPLNTAPLETAMAHAAPSSFAADTLIVNCAGTAWQYDGATLTLRSGTRSVPVTPLFVGGELGIYRLRRGGP